MGVRSADGTFPPDGSFFHRWMLFVSSSFNRRSRSAHLPFDLVEGGVVLIHRGWTTDLEGVEETTWNAKHVDETMDKPQVET